jgi:3-dehydroquinate dehydratase I
MNCLSIVFESVDQCLEHLKNFEIVEYRLDKINFQERIPELFKVSIPTIATYRPSNNVSDLERKNILKQAIDNGANYIDIELDANEEYLKELVNYAKQKNTKIILSYHDYIKTPAKRELEQIIFWAKDYSPDIIKIACQVNNKKDNARLISLYESDFPLVVLGMGEKGKITRIASILLGAPFTFVAFDKNTQTAQGQFSSDELNDILNRI